MNASGEWGEKEGVIIHVESQREAVDEEGAGKEIEMRGEGLRWVETCAGVQRSGVVENVEKHLLLGTTGEK